MILYVNPGQDSLSIEDLPAITATTTTSVLPSFHSAANDDEMLRKIRDRILRISAQVVEPELFKPLKALLTGAPLVNGWELGWHNTVLKVTMWIARKEKNLSPEALHRLFEKSIDTMIAIDPSWDGWKEVETAYAGACAKVTAPTAPTGNGSLAPYSPEELAFIAQQQKCSVEELSKRWVIQKGTTYFILGPTGGYESAVEKEAYPLAFELLARAPIILTELTQKGPRYRPIVELVVDYGRVCKRIIADLSLGQTVFDAAENTMCEAVCPFRTAEPQEDPEIAEWLRLFAGSGEKHERLLRWLAAFPQLKWPTAALYIKGEPSTGKGLLAIGLSRLWTQGSWTPLAAVFRSFNDAIAQCPLIVADESVSVPRGVDPVAQLQSMIGSVNHELNVKYRNWGSIVGAVRVMLTANNDDLLRSSSSTPEERRALLKKIFVLSPPAEAARYLTSLGGFEALHQKWVKEDRIAKHALYLASVIPVQGDRFAFEGEDDKVSQDVLRTKWERWVLEWLANYLKNPAPAESNPEVREFVRAEEGAVLVNSNAIKKGWYSYLGLSTRQDPDIHQIQKAVATLGGLRVQKNRTWFYPISLETIIDFADDLGITDAATVMRVANRPARLALVNGGAQ